MKIKLILNYDVLYTGPEFDLESTIRKYPKKVLLEFLSYILHFNRRGKPNLRNFLFAFFSTDSFGFRDDVIKELQRKGLETDNLELTVESNLVLLMDKILTTPDNEFYETEVNNKSAFEVDLFKSIIFQNEIQDQADVASIQEITKSDASSMAIIKILITHELPIYELQNLREDDVIILELVKAHYLFLFLHSNEKYAILLKSFIQSYNSPSIEFLLRHLFQIILMTYNYGDPNSIRIYLHVPLDSGDNEFALDFIRTFANGSSHIQDDHLNIRSNPLFETEDSNFLVLNPIFIYQKLYRGWYFILNRLNEKLPKSARIKELKSTIGIDFFENYLLPRLLSPFISGKMVNHSGEEIRKFYPKFDAEPDHYIRNFDDIFLFEIKDVLLKKEIKVSLNFDEIEKELKEKLLVKSSGKPSAVKQLANSAGKILAQDIPYDTPSNKTKIYPILVLTDEIFNTPGINFLINTWFSEVLESMSKDTSILKRVMPLTIITVDTLIRMENSGNIKKLKAYLKEFHKKHLNSALKKPSNLVSFQNFMQVRGYFKMDFNEFKKKAMSLIFPNGV